jgi:hypothetical protein
MIEITVRIKDKEATEQIDGLGAELVKGDILPKIVKGTPELAGKSNAEALVALLSKLLKDYTRRAAGLWGS